MSTIVVMASEPFKGHTPEQIRCFMSHCPSDEDIAAMLAGVANRAGWLSHDVDDPDYDEETKQRIVREFVEWQKLEKELCSEIIHSLQQENRISGTKHITYGIGYFYIVKPFMERNGYWDGGGWWLKKE